ncbi:DUF1109 domain-containing protein [Stenotrophomonas acidaminiphila]|uniref:DUF1109 domain-containing protein n=1 Tax=Stenotrophomonas acidaminiphila TaxID=128780 RepID=UPI002404C3B2|nr:DUF1109 domain-containing protein [Stenotrophomonas acidaminiphila]MDF9442314.1 DUF1109 domain-containing protein [Stenotrophomonas acidaminiphila]
MKTHELIDLLASDPMPVQRHAAARRFGLALPLGLLMSLGLLRVGFGLRPDLAEASIQPMFWAKAVFALAMFCGALWVTLRLSRPGQAVAAAVLWLASGDERLAMLMGRSWRSCAFSIALLSLPLMGTTFWAVRGLAPTRLRLAGASAGLLAGGAATLVYCLHCPEMDAPFWAVWYVLGLSLPTAAGALLGPRLLRW